VVAVVVAGVVEGVGVGAALVVADMAGEVRAFFLPCGRFEAVFALPAPVERTIRLLVVSLVTLVSEAATPDEYEPEACFDRMGVLEMDAGAAKIDSIGILSGLGAGPAGAPSDGAGPGETKRGAATAQITKASAANVIMQARTTKNGRFPQTGLTNFILTRTRRQRHPSFGGGQLF
jgi:hypothetical protein